MSIPVTIIFHIPNDQVQDQASLNNTLQSIKSLHGDNFDCIALAPKETTLGLDPILKNTPVITRNNESESSWLKKAFSSAEGRRILYIDNQKTQVLLKQGCLQVFQTALDRDPNAGMVYSDYVSETEDSHEEIRLLKHHSGRVRDNLDYGKVYFFRRGILRQFGFLDEELNHLHFYDLRLKVSEISNLVHIGNRMGGHLYSVNNPKSSQNVFDYLMSGKEVQLEAENILTQHLIRIGAYLPPGWNYQNRPKKNTPSELKASIIIPVNDRPEFIGDAIVSVQNQTVQDIEVIIVVNGGDKDPTCVQVKRYQENGDLYNINAPKIRLIITDINNIGFCLNLGLRSAEGEFYVQLDSDDRLKKDAVEKILEKFSSDQRIGMVIGSYDVWEKSKDGDLSRMESIPTVTHAEWTEKNGRNNLLRINGAGAPRSIPVNLAEEIGLFGINEQPYSLNYGEDYEMVMKISEKYKIGRILDPIYEVVRHSGGTDHNIDQATVDRNDEAKDFMRLEAIRRRKNFNPPKSDQ